MWPMRPPPPWPPCIPPPPWPPCIPPPPWPPPPPPRMALADVGASMARPSAALAATARRVDLRIMTLSFDPWGSLNCLSGHWSGGSRKRFSALLGALSAFTRVFDALWGRPHADAVQIQQSRDKQGPR